VECSALDQTNLQEVFEEAVRAVFADQKGNDPGPKKGGGGKKRDCVVQ
jgi:hypothetical protein